MIIIQKIKSLAHWMDKSADGFMPPEKAIWGSILLFFSSLMIYSIWVLDRGFEITDESYYFLLAKNPEAVTLYISAQHWIMSPLWDVTGTIASYRGIGLLILIVSSSLLAYGSITLWKKLSPDFSISTPNKALVYIGSISSALLYGSAINFSPCYNLLASAGSYIGLGMVFMALGTDRNLIVRTAYCFVAGLAISIEFLSKASSGICTLGLLIVAIALFTPSRLQIAAKILVLVLTTFIGMFAIMHANTDYATASHDMRQGLDLFKIVQSESTSDRLIRYFVEYAQYTGQAVFFFIVPIALFILYALQRKTVFLFSGIITLIAMLLLCGNFLGGADGRYIGQIQPLIIILLMVALLSYPVWAGHWQKICFTGLLFALPYTVAVGTGNPIFTQIIASAAPWGAGAAILYASASTNDTARKTGLLALCALLIGLVSLQTITSGLRVPYNLSGSLWKQSNAIQIGDIGTVKVDRGTYEFITDLNKAREECSIQPDNPVLAFYNVPGVVLALHGIAPASQWINNIEQADFVMGRIDTDVKKSSILTLQLEGDERPQLPAEIGKSFPNEYRLCGKAVYPYRSQSIEIWERR